MDLVKIPAGCGFSTVLPEMDFETFSTAGYVYDEDAQKWRSLSDSPPHGLGAVGGAAYSEHESTEILSLAYDLKDGLGPRLWVPGLPPPADLFAHIAAGGLIEAHNSAFEFFIWNNVAVNKLGWPALPLESLRCSKGKARAWGLPGALDKIGDILDTDAKKDADGKRLLNKFSKHRNPTLNDARLRIRPEEDPEDAARLYSYNVDDIRAEAAVSAKIPDLIPHELELWLLDQKINARGVGIDVATLAACENILEQAFARYTEELVRITDGAVDTPGQIAAITSFIEGRGHTVPSLKKEAVADLLESGALDPVSTRVLEIRQILGSASVKKVAAIRRRLCRDGRLRGLFEYCGADRTGRFAGRGPQPQNFPSSGPRVARCSRAGCERHARADLDACPWCGSDERHAVDWSEDAAADCREILATGSLDAVERFFGDPVDAVSGCLRGLFCAAPGYDLISSDYSAIEAVVLAVLAGEQWRIDVFNDHGKIYEMSAAKITGIPFDEFMRHKRETGDHHPMRKKVGKVAELASGYQGGVNAWKQFGADKFMTDPEIDEAKKAWRRESPMICKFWYGLEDAARAAIQSPGACFSYRSITYGVKDDVLYCLLPSGRKLAYHRPRLHPERTPWGKEVLKITFEGWHSLTKKWVRLDTYGGKLTENVVQAVSRDILTHALPNLERAGYETVLHVHDEVVCQVPEGFGSVEELEAILGDLPPWAAGWPVRAAGGWRGKNFRKD